LIARLLYAFVDAAVISSIILLKKYSGRIMKFSNHIKVEGLEAYGKATVIGKLESLGENARNLLNNAKTSAG
jgi:hypothetical protein